MSIQSRINNDAVGTPPELGTKQVGRGAKIGMAVLTLAILIPPFVTTSLELTKLSRLAVLVLAVLGVNLLTGYTGLISLGHGVFVGVGAFAMANFIDQGLSLYIAGFLATIFTGLIGLILGLPALRVRGLYLALVTFGTALAFPPFARRLGTWTGGVSGRNVDNDAFVPPAFLRLDDHVHVWRYGICIAVVALWFVIIRNLVDSRMGRALRTVRDNESAAATFGISVRYAKAGALAISCSHDWHRRRVAGHLEPLYKPCRLRLFSFASFVCRGCHRGSRHVGRSDLWRARVDRGSCSKWGSSNCLDSDAIVFGAGLIIMTFVAPTGIAGLFEGRGRGKSSTP